LRVVIFDAFGNALSRSVVLLLLFAAALAPAKAADDVAPFYAGKQIRFIIGSAPGGTYDVLASRRTSRPPAARQSAGLEEATGGIRGRSQPASIREHGRRVMVDHDHRSWPSQRSGR
jgi:hypothetical protein